MSAYIVLSISVTFDTGIQYRYGYFYVHKLLTP